MQSKARALILADERRQEYLDVHWCQIRVIHSKIFKIKSKVSVKLLPDR